MKWECNRIYLLLLLTVMLASIILPFPAEAG